MRALLVALLFSSSAFAASDLDWPQITSQTKPWSRWWWLGNIGTKQDFTTQMEKYAQAGLGGLEITPIYGVRGEESRFKNYLSPEWMDSLDHVLDEGKRLGLGIDMSTGTGWPFGGPWVTPDFSARHVVTKTFAVKGGEKLAEPVSATDQPIVRLAGSRRVTLQELKDPVAANENLQDLALDQVRFPRRLELQALVGYAETGEKVVLTDKVAADGKLDWTAPAGNWTLYAVFLGWHGKQVERAGPGGEGDVIDHFSAGALARYLKKFDDAYAGHRANRLRAYFNDSYEVDDASGESNWTPHFFDEFKKRRGYDLRDELPAFFGKDTADKNARVISDHRETISDLLLEEFTQPWAKWAHAHGGLIRNQAHGSPANIVDLYAASDIPETEGANIVGMKLASSAAHVTGKPLASSETATWLDEHWVSTLNDVKRRVDLMFLGGVNHNCYHGTVFSPPNEPWPGHHFYAAVELDPSNSIWADFDILNAYVARAQSFLQAGKPANDILLYYPIHDLWAQRGNGAMPHFGGGARAGGMGVAQELMLRGYTFDFVSDRLLATVQAKNGALDVGGNRYRAIVVPEVKFMPLETLAQLQKLADAGATVIFDKSLPGDVAGFGHLDERRADFRRRLTAFTRARVGDNLGKLLDDAAIPRETLADAGLQFERRTLGGSRIYFLRNPGDKTFEGFVPLATPTAQAAIFDPMTGRSGLARTRKAPERDEVFVILAPNATCIVKTFSDAGRTNQPRFDYWQAGANAAAAPTLQWSFRFVSGGPTIPSYTATGIEKPGSWTEQGGDETKAFSGTASYTTTFDWSQRADVWLDLGRVADSARIKVNGKEVAALIAPPWQTVISQSLLKPTGNTLEVLVTNLTANRIADLDRRDPSWKHFYNTNYPARIGTNRGPDGNFSAAKWTPRASGLLGPVTIAPAEPRPPLKTF